MSIRIPIELNSAVAVPRTKKVKTAQVPFWKRDIQLFQSGLNEVRKERLFREMHLLLNAGVDPRSVLDLMLNAQKDEASKQVMTDVRDAVLRGDALSAAMERVGRFTQYEVQSMKIGEENGKLAPVCFQLAEHHADRLKLKRMVRQAFAYPIFVFCITLGVVFFMMNVVVPMFAQVFARSGAELPALTKQVLRVSVLLRTGWPFLLAGFGALVAVVLAFKEKPLWKKWSERIMLRLPVFGELRRQAMLARFCRSMAFLLGSGTPLDRALELSERMTDSAKLDSALHTIRIQVVRGSTLKEAMQGYPVFDAQLVAMIGVAEEVKQLDTMFLRLSERYTADVQHRTSILGSVLEPATILLIAVLVGVVLVAMYLPMFKLSTTF